MNKTKFFCKDSSNLNPEAKISKPQFQINNQDTVRTLKSLAFYRDNKISTKTTVQVKYLLKDFTNLIHSKTDS